MLRLSTNIHDQRLDGDLGRLPAELRRIADLGMDSVEIGLHGLDAIRCGRLDRNRAERFRGIVDDFPLTLTLHAPDNLDLMCDREGDLHRAVLESSLELCSAAGAELLVVHPGRWTTESDFGIKPPAWPDEALAADLAASEAEILRGFADAFPGTTIALENARPFLPYSPCTYAEFPDRLAAQVERIDRPNVGCCLDTGHLHMSSRLHGFDEARAALSLRERLVHLHMHDNFGRTGWWSEKTQTQMVPFGRGDLHMPPGLGDIDFAGVLGPLLDGWDGIAVCELRSRYGGELPGHLDGFRRILSSILLPEPA